MKIRVIVRGDSEFTYDGEHPERVAGKTSGSGVINGRELARRVLDVIGGAQ